MPRITVERKVSVGNSVFEIKQQTYELPDMIFYNKQCLSYDSYHGEYSNNNYTISAKDYLEIVLKQHEVNKQNQMQAKLKQSKTKKQNIKIEQ